MYGKLVFVSQPMKRRSNKEILDERNAFLQDTQVSNRIMDELGTDGFNVIESIVDVGIMLGVKSEPVYYLSKSFDKLALADLAVFMPGWERSDGCVMEHHACMLYGIPHLDF